jgi:hypothetical protein
MEGDHKMLPFMVGPDDGDEGDGERDVSPEDDDGDDKKDDPGPDDPDPPDELA